MKFKVGDKVKVIAKRHGHEFDIGEIVRIEEVSDIDYKCSSLKKNEFWWMGEDEFVEWKFTKSDLKDGDIVTQRNGLKKMVFENKLYGSNHFVSLTYYTEDLKDANGDEEYDIIKIERPGKYNTIFERKEEILNETEKRYLASVIKPFKNKIETIEKTIKIGDSSLCYLIMLLKNNDMANLPNFKKNSMYKGMEVNKKYSLKELGL